MSSLEALGAQLIRVVTEGAISFLLEELAKLGPVEIHWLLDNGLVGNEHLPQSLHFLVSREIFLIRVASKISTLINIIGEGRLKHVLQKFIVVFLGKVLWHLELLTCASNLDQG